MNTVVVYGNERKGSTYHIVQMFLIHLCRDGDNLTEFFLPRDMPHFCVGCSKCFAKGEEFCPHRQAVASIQEAMRTADLLIFSSPVYVLRASGQMKALLDHFAFQFMIHRPAKDMFTKNALIVTTAYGGGMQGVVREIMASLDMWGVGRVFSYRKAIFAVNWDGVSAKKKARIRKSVDKISAEILAGSVSVRPRVKVKLLFHIYRNVQRKNPYSKIDSEYWKRKGWLGNVKPWQDGRQS